MHQCDRGTIYQSYRRVFQNAGDGQLTCSWLSMARREIGGSSDQGCTCGANGNNSKSIYLRTQELNVACFWLRKSVT